MLGSIDRGSYAEYVLVRPNEAAAKPARLSHIEAAAVPLAALTAWQGLFDHGQLEAGQTVLIHGGSGGVGHFAIQFAKIKGAAVLTTVSGQNLDFVGELGADRAIDYTSQGFEEIARDVDLVLDLVGGETQERSWRVPQPHSRPQQPPSCGASAAPLRRASRNDRLTAARVPDVHAGRFPRVRGEPFATCARLPRAEFAFADHPLVSVHLVLDSVPRSVAFAEEQANYLEAALSRVFDAPLREEFHCLADAVLVL